MAACAPQAVVSPSLLHHCADADADADAEADDGSLTLSDLPSAAASRLSLAPAPSLELPPSPPATASRSDAPSTTSPASSAASLDTGRGSLVFAPVSADGHFVSADWRSVPADRRSVPAAAAAAAASEPPPPTPRQRPQSTAVRKPSPGLAARLRALGFGGAKKPPSPPTLRPDCVGRLDEQQLRHFHQEARADSPVGAPVSSRSRAWKGGGDSPTRSVAAESPESPSPPKPPRPAAVAAAAASEPPPAMETHKKLPRSERAIARSPSPDHGPPPPPPPKDAPPLAVAPTAAAAAAAADYVPGLSSYFTSGRERPGSIYTLSRASFANQLAQLTSLQLPDAESLSSKVSAIRSAQVAAKALINAAEQIRSWIFKAHEVIGGLDGDDDVEWAAAGGREGLEEVENATARFEHLINVYVGAIEELQARADIPTVSSEDLRRAVSQMESILDEWAKMRATLHGVRSQVEIAMEWEELWNSVLGEIQDELDDLSRLVFEMEERRHRTIVSGADAVDMGDLETIVEETPAAAASRLQAPGRLSLVAGLPPSPTATPSSPGLSADDSSLLALFARMQPLRASLDFLPMRLSVFEARADKAFPTACEELEMRRDELDAGYRKLERDAESLRKELGEDRWVVVFRGAGRQAQKMLESVQRSLHKLREALDAGLQLSNPAAMTKKTESYEAKKLHYGPAIERVLSIIERGVGDRLTVNGEIVRLHGDMQARWEALKGRIRAMDAVLDDVLGDRRGQQLRDSVSSLLSNDRSTLGSGLDTPGSSPPSSVIMSSLGLGLDPHTPVAKGRLPAAVKAGARRSSLPAPVPQAPASQPARRTGIRLSTVAAASATPSTQSPRSAASLAHRPRWNTSTNLAGLDTGHHYSSPLSATTPSPYARSASALSPPTGSGRLPPLQRGALTRAASESPSVRETLPKSSHSRLTFRETFREPSSSPGATGATGAHQFISKPRALLSKSSMSALTPKRRATVNRSGSAADDGGPAARPASSLALTSRRSSLLPLPRERREDGGRASSRLGSASRSSSKRKAADGKDSKPKWRVH